MSNTSSKTKRSQEVVIAYNSVLHVSFTQNVWIMDTVHTAVNAKEFVRGACF